MHLPALNRQRVTINLEDAFLEEQKLYQILEVSYSYKTPVGFERQP